MHHTHKLKYEGVAVGLDDLRLRVSEDEEAGMRNVGVVGERTWGLLKQITATARVQVSDAVVHWEETDVHILILDPSPPVFIGVLAVYFGSQSPIVAGIGADIFRETDSKSVSCPVEDPCLAY